ncbi:uncharacterized protein ACIBXB_008988 [Morphnus guianensis]
MSARKQKAPGSMEQGESKVALPQRRRGLVGALSDRQSLPRSPQQLLLFSLLQLFANELFQQGAREAGLMGFLPEDIRRTIARAAQKHCFVCGESGAAISCWEMGCDRSFHLPCAAEGGCVTQFALQYRYLLSPPRCHPGKEPALLTSPIPFLLPPGPSAGSTAQSRQWRRLRRRTPPASSAWTLWRRESPTAPWCAQRANTPGSTGAASRQEPFPHPQDSLAPGARQALGSTRASLRLLMFLLLQGQAVCAGISCFQCPLCRDKELFLSEMLTMGIRIPFRLVPFWPAHKTGGCKRCAAPGAAPAVLPGPPLSRESGLQLHGGAGNRAGGASRDALQLPYAGAAGAHPFSFLHQTAIMGEQACIRSTK